MTDLLLGPIGRGFEHFYDRCAFEMLVISRIVRRNAKKELKNLVSLLVCLKQKKIISYAIVGASKFTAFSKDIVPFVIKVYNNG